MGDTELRKIDELVLNAQITVTPEEVEEAKKQIAIFYKNTNYTGDIAKRVEEVVTKAMIRWTRAPKDFWERCITQIGYRAYSKYQRYLKELEEAKRLGLEHEDWEEIYKPERKKKEFKSNDNQISSLPESLDLAQYSVYGDSLVDFLNGEEKKFWFKRELQYRREFDFNDSSDRILLEEAIYIEVLLRRVRIAKITGENLDKVKGLKEDDLIDNHRKVLDKLGILRVQRIQFDSNIEGNVGEIALLLDEKIDGIKNLKNAKLLKRTLQKINDKYRTLTMEEIEELIEEQSLLREVEKLGELNIIPQAVYAQISNDIEKKTRMLNEVQEISKVSSENSMIKEPKIDNSTEYSSLQDVF